MINFNTAKLEIGAADGFSIPEQVVNKPKANDQMRLEMLGFELNTKDTFNFNFKDVENKDATWIDTKDQTMVFADKYSQMDFKLPSWNVTGFGERVSQTNLTQGAWTMWGKNKQPEMDFGEGEGKQTTGVHPFIMFKNPKTGTFGGMFFRNSNYQAPIVRFNTTDQTTIDLSYITTGNKIEVYFFLSGTAEFVI